MRKYRGSRSGVGAKTAHVAPTKRTRVESVILEARATRCKGERYVQRDRRPPRLLTQLKPQQSTGNEISRHKHIASERMYVDHSAPQIKGVVAVVGEEERVCDPVRASVGSARLGTAKALWTHVKVLMIKTTPMRPSADPTTRLHHQDPAESVTSSFARILPERQLTWVSAPGQ